jgi:SAM-dependent methyltransferase
MPDIYASIAEADPAIVHQLADRLELRAADPHQRAMLHAYLADVAFLDAAHVLEVGCGSGAITRVLARWPGVHQVLGIDPSPLLLERARHLAEGIPNVSFEQADGRSLPVEDACFDVVVFYTSLCHIPEPRLALAEAYRVLSLGGRLVIFDGDYATTTVATSPDDPLQSCIEAAIGSLIHDPLLMRHLPALVRAAGFDVWEFRGHAYTRTDDVAYLLALVQAGADFPRRQRPHRRRPVRGAESRSHPPRRLGDLLWPYRLRQPDGPQTFACVIDRLAFGVEQLRCVFVHMFRAPPCANSSATSGSMRTMRASISGS